MPDSLSLKQALGHTHLTFRLERVTIVVIVTVTTVTVLNFFYLMQLGSNDALEGRFALLEGGFSGVEDDFQQMKKSMASSGRLPQKSTEQSPTTIYWTS